jgi:hypothetical protein
MMVFKYPDILGIRICLFFTSLELSSYIIGILGLIIFKAFADF